MTTSPSTAPAIYFGLQHYLSLAGSLIFIPLVMVPTMGGSDVSVNLQNLRIMQFES